MSRLTTLILLSCAVAAPMACSEDPLVPTPEPADASVAPGPDAAAPGLDASTILFPDAGTPDAATPPDASTAQRTDAGVPAARPGCGDGKLDPKEVCDGDLLHAGNTCDDNWLGNGQVACTSRCSLDVSGCEDADYCAGNMFYSDVDLTDGFGGCDACELMGGHDDPDCAAHCGADGFCATWFDPSVAAWSCQAAGYGQDPDCICGNGVVEGNEWCDGDQYVTIVFQDASVTVDACTKWTNPATGEPYTGGTYGCLPDCMPDFRGCL